MFGQNEIVGLKYFKNATNKLLVTSVFYTLQGEGPFAGTPAVFVRLAKCNLACDFCDTWFDSGDWLTLEEVFRSIRFKIDDYFKGNVPKWADYCEGGYSRDMVLVVTGGEPTLQNEMLAKLTYEGQKQFRYVQIETNGILPPDVPPHTTIVCSPKCVNDRYIKPHQKVLDKAFFKFVLSANPDSPYHRVPDWALEYDKERVYISPMNTYLRPCRRDEISSFWTPGLLDHEQNEKNHLYAAKYCLENGFILNLQQHIYTSLA